MNKSVDCLKFFFVGPCLVALILTFYFPQFFLLCITFAGIHSFGVKYKGISDVSMRGKRSRRRIEI